MDELYKDWKRVDAPEKMFTPSRKTELKLLGELLRHGY